MTTNRLVDIYTLMERHEREDPQRISFCDVAAEIVHVSGAGVLLQSGGDLVTRFCTSSNVARDLLDFEIAIGEGPGIDASYSGVAIDEGNLMSPATARWSIYTPMAIASGARAVFGFPVRIGAIRFGALSLFRDSPGPLSQAESSDAYLMASVIGRGVLGLQAGAPRGALAKEIELQSTLDFSVHQAAGMVAVQGSMTIRDALVSLRAHAFATSATLSVLSERVVARRTRYVRDTGVWEDDYERSMP